MPLKGWDTEFEDILPNSPAGVCGSACCCIVNFILIILFFPCTVTQLGQFKIGILRNKVTGSVDLESSYEPGRYWIGFWKEFVEFPSTLNTIEFSSEKPEEGVQNLNVLRSRDRDGKQVNFDISVQYLLHKDDLGKIYRDMLTGYEDIYISELRDAFARATNLFPIQDAWNDYPSMVRLMQERCENVLRERFAECWGIQVWGVSLTGKYEEKLILTQVRKQAVRTEIARKVAEEVRVKTQVELSEYRKNVTILRAGGEAARYNLERTAFARGQRKVVEAQAHALQVAKDVVCPSWAKAAQTSGEPTCSDQQWKMSGKQLIEYFTMGLVKMQPESNIIFNMKGGNHLDAANVVASKNIIEKKVRRRLKTLEPGKKVRRRLKTPDPIPGHRREKGFSGGARRAPTDGSPGGLLNLDDLHQVEGVVVGPEL